MKGLGVMQKEKKTYLGKVLPISKKYSSFLCH